MKKIFLLILIIVLNSPIVYSWSWSGTQSFDCDGCCVEDKTFQYLATITNTGNSSFSLIKSELRDYYGSTIVVSSFSANLNPGSTRSFTLTGNFPEPSDGYLTYHICFYLSEQRTNWLGVTYTHSDWSCSKTQTKKVTPKSNFKCFTDRHCTKDHYCYISPSCTSECLPVSRGDCGHIVNHKWVDYECCSNSDCPKDKTCSNNYCVDILCSCGYISNNKCIKYDCCADSDCDFGYFCSGNFCFKHECMENKDCKSHQYCLNHNCINLNCGYCQYIVNHNCISHECCKNEECNTNQRCHENLCENLNCGYGYYASNHHCKKYECMVNNDCDKWKRCENNNCVKVECPSNQIIKFHRCENIKGIQRFLGYVKENRYISFFTKESFYDYQEIYISILSLIFISTIGFVYLLIRKNKKSKHYTKLEEEEIEPKNEEKLIKKKFCNKCGHKVKDNEKYCIKCGHQLV